MQPQGQQMIEPIARELLLIGGGHTHALFLRSLGMNPVPGLRVTLVTPDYRSAYSGMLPGHVAGHYQEDDIHIDLVPLCRFAGAALVVDEVTGIDPDAQRVSCRSHPDLHYDVVSLNIGIKPLVPPGLDCPEIIPVKPINSFLDRWHGFLKSHEATPLCNIGVIGGGAGGVELALAMQHRLSTFTLGAAHSSAQDPAVNANTTQAAAAGASHLAAGASQASLLDASHLPAAAPHQASASGSPQPTAAASGSLYHNQEEINSLQDCQLRVHLFTAGELLADYATGVRRKIADCLAGRNIKLYQGFRAKSLNQNKMLQPEQGQPVAIDAAFLVTDAAAHPWPWQGGLSQDDKGFIRVRDTLQAENYSNVFAVGDCASMINHPRPKAGVYAVRQAKPLFTNVMRYLRGEKPRPFKPQARFLSLISTGSRSAIAHRNGVTLTGPWVWRWKNRIDQQFMVRFRDLPIMSTAQMRRRLSQQLKVPGPFSHEFDEQMQCGGCGAKVSADILNDVLDELALGVGQRQAQPVIQIDQSQAQPVIQIDQSQAQPGLAGNHAQAQPGLEKEQAQTQPGLAGNHAQAQPSLEQERGQTQPGIEDNQAQSQTAIADENVQQPRDDAAVIPTPPGQIVLQSVDHFRSFHEAPYELARIAAVHAMSDIHACGGQVMTAQVLVTLPRAKPQVTRNLLSQVMAGAKRVLDEDGVTLSGGHSSEGMELSIGLAVTGSVDEGGFLPKQGLQLGDKLVLTKPLGTGVLLAAEMQMKARGAWLAAALASMQLSSRQAAMILANYDIHGCTDLTGFGLAGHLLEMLVDDAGLGVSIDMDALPVLPGAIECLAAGVRSSLHAGNASACNLGDQLPPILLDPQTSGGLLFGLPPVQAVDSVARLQDAGYADAAIIGEVVTCHESVGSNNLVISPIPREALNKSRV